MATYSGTLDEAPPVVTYQIDLALPAAKRLSRELAPVPGDCPVVKRGDGAAHGFLPRQRQFGDGVPPLHIRRCHRVN